MKLTDPVTYAPLYSKTERIKLVAIQFCWLIPSFLFFRFYFLPRFNEFAQHSECHEIGSINGARVLFFGIFVGLPLLLAASLFLLEGFRSIRAFKVAQYPPPNEKVFKVTRYRYGRSAKRRAAVPFLIILFLLGLGVWGGYQANDLSQAIKPCRSANL